MLTLTIGFKGHHKSSEAQCLYAGHDADEALRIAKNPPAGFATCHIFKHLVPVKRIPQLAPVDAAPQETAAPEPAPVDDSPPADAPPEEAPDAPADAPPEEAPQLLMEDRPPGRRK